MTHKTEATASLDAHTIAAIVGQAVSAALAANRPGAIPAAALGRRRARHD
jgi:hypothetical protein